ncbi:19981_t:CDS:2, partial [Rhizophagus irregularis]
FHDMDPEPRHISEFDCTVNAVNFYMLITVDDSPSKFNPTTRRKIIGYKFYDLVIRVNTPLKIKYNLEVWKISVQYESTFALNRDLDVKKKLLDSGL